MAFAAAPAWAAGEDPPSIKTDANVDVLARIGVVILLFEVGLESTVPT